ncbi:MAG: MarR family winged helix-turn-helix transcriptional regulator [Thermodesulfobacteriota bacterium]
MGTIDKNKGREMARICACFNLRRTTRLVSQAYDQALKPLGLKITQLSVLMAAHGMENMLLTKLAAGMGMDRTTLSRNLKLLEKKGLVELGKGEDRREIRVRLTEKGYATMKQAIPLWEEAQARLVESFGPGRYEEMLSDLRALAKVVRR